MALNHKAYEIRGNAYRMHAELNAWTKMSADCSAAEKAALYRDTAARGYRLAV